MPGLFVGELDYDDYDEWEFTVNFASFPWRPRGVLSNVQLFCFHISRSLGAENYYDCAGEY